MKTATLLFMDTRSCGPRVGDEIIGRSAAVAGVLDLVGRVAATDTPVLISGETGTGKELTAHTLHLRSLRAQRPFVAVKLDAVSVLTKPWSADDLLDSLHVTLRRTHDLNISARSIAHPLEFPQRRRAM
jgi:hypothetical protein